MFEAWGRFIFRRRRLVLLIAGLAVIAAAVWGTGVFGKLQSAGGFAPPASQSQQEADLAARTFGQDAADVVLLYSSKDLTVAAPAYKSAVTSSLARLPRGAVRRRRPTGRPGRPDSPARAGTRPSRSCSCAAAATPRRSSPGTRSTGS